eukprot:CAMPEP_0178424484 /NCGR_PEP_ID=MMETSP0689_2-20121128/28233_1 /TAXON_ID=160604 /ORGANISM="Amphidinium massartii, Strain CS-259" /LENGTH=87 /DNA_ID=CAMNT_0020046121 /DNA_START=525 /DNA_END=789 /DNA_ORIENTATION=+
MAKVQSSHLWPQAAEAPRLPSLELQQPGVAPQARAESRAQCQGELVESHQTFLHIDARRGDMCPASHEHDVRQVLASAVGVCCPSAS